MQQALSEQSPASRSCQSPYLILKFLSHEGQVFLEATEFALLGTEVRRSARGTNSVLPNLGTFRWNHAVRALCILALRYFIHRESDRPEDRSLAGGAGSLAASLDYSIAKNTGWLADVFGSDSNGTLVVRKLITRQNPERKRPGPVVVAFTKKVLDMRFYLNGEELATPNALIDLLTLLEPSQGLTQSTIQSETTCDRLNQQVLAGRSQTGQEAVAPGSVCPYKGLLPFKGSDSSLYFGRENETEHLMETVLRVPFVVIFGPSGVGKSSLISAGLIPLLSAQDSLSSGSISQWRSATFRPMEDPTEAMVVHLLAALGAENEDAPPRKEVISLTAALKAGNATPLVAALGRLRKGAGPLLIFIDQFEELFTVCSEESREGFYQAIQAVIDADPLCRFVCALRSDFFPEFLSSGLGHYLERGTFPLLAMRRDQIKRAIELPALTMGRKFEQGLVATILNDAAEEPGALPLVQFVLERLWDSCAGQPGDITLQSYKSLGRLSGALAAHADSVLANLSPEERSKARNLLGRLVRVAVDKNDVRDSRVSLKLTSEISKEFASIIETLTEARLLVASREPSAQESSIDLSHEAIIQHWETLRAWIAEDRQFLSWRTRISPLVAQIGRPDSDIEEAFLLRGRALEEAKVWMESSAGRLTGLELRFIQTSIDAYSDEIERKYREEMESAIMALRSVTYGDFAATLKVLKADYPKALECLEYASEGEGNKDALLRFFLARLAYGDESVSVLKFIQDYVLQLPIDSFVSVVDLLRPHQMCFVGGLWKQVKGSNLLDAQFLRAAALLSQFDHQSSRWKSLSDRVVRYLSREPATVVVPIGALYRPIREYILEPLLQLCTSKSEGEARRGSAALLLAILGQNDTSLMARLATLADAGQYSVFFETLNESAKSIEEAKKWWLKNLESMATMTTKELAGTVFNLCKVGSAPVGVPALFSNPSDLSPFSEFVGLCVTHGLDYEVIWAALEESTDPQTLYALVLALGSAARPPDSWLEQRLPLLAERYRENPHAGVHSALRWLFEVWGLSEIRRKIDHELATSDIQWSRGWFTLDICGHPCTFAVFETFEDGRKSRFGIAVAPVTREEFSNFRTDTDMDKYGQYHPTPESPVVGVSWFDALEYSRWIQGNLPSSIGLEIRLPTDDEWELACRQGTTTDFFFGKKQEHFQLFGWYYANAVSSTMPVATLRPSPWGLFDMHGNVWEWLMDEYSQDGVKLTGASEGGQAGRGDSRLLRGGAWCDSPTWCRATERSNPHWPSDRNLMFGFRVSCVERHVAS